MQSEVFKLLAFALEDGKNILITADMKFIDGRPVAILEYLAAGDKEVMRIISLDPALIQKVNLPDHDYFYQGQIIMPRAQDN